MALTRGRARYFYEHRTMNLTLPGCLLLIIAAPAVADTPTALRYRGIATDHGGAVLYQEDHLLNVDAAGDEHRLVVYRCPSGEAFARKTLSRTAGTFVPDFELDDRRGDYREGVKRAGGAYRVFAGVGDEASRETDVAAGPASVADAGFDAFVQAHRPALERGETLSMQFIIPSDRRSRSLTVSKVDQGVVLGRPASLYRLKLGAWYAFVAPHIDGWYDRANGQLLRYVGISNIRGATGRNLTVSIDFPPDQRDRTPDGASRSTLLAEPLTAHCAD